MAEVYIRTARNELRLFWTCHFMYHVCKSFFQICSHTFILQIQVITEKITVEFIYATLVCSLLEFYFKFYYAF